MLYLLLFLLLLPLPAWANSIILDATTQTVKLTTSTTASIDYAVTYADHTTTSFVPGLSKGNIATATTTTILSAPASSTQRQVKWLSLQNNSATTANVVTLKLDVSGTTYNLGPSLSLELGEALHVGTEGRFTILTANGLVKVSSTAVTGTFWQATQPVSIASMPSTPVTGTFWQATQPVSGTFWQATQPVSIASMPSTPVTGTFWQATQPVSGTVTTTPPSNASTNVAQMGGVATSMNTGVRDTGTQRVTIATNDSVPVTGTFFQGTQPVSGTVTTTPPSNASTNVAQVAGTATDTNSGLKSAGTMRVVIATDQPALTNKLLVTPDSVALPANQSVNVAQVAGTNTVTAASGVQKVGIIGNANGAFDIANNAALPANLLVIGAETRGQGVQPTAATTGNGRQLLASLEGSLFVTPYSSNKFSCFVQAVTVTTQCQAAPGAGLRAYVTNSSLSNQAATVQTLDIVFGTGSNCVTGTTALTHKWQMGTNATTTSPQSLESTFLNPLTPTAANAICVRPSAATAFGATLTGYIAP